MKIFEAIRKEIFCDHFFGVLHRALLLLNFFQVTGEVQRSSFVSAKVIKLR